MDKEELLGLFKYYREEKVNPFIGKDLMKAKWWEGEKDLLTKVENDTEVWQRITDAFNDAIKGRGVSGNLIDESIAFNQRAIYFYLDLWNGKNFPNDSLDDIFEYIKA